MTPAQTKPICNRPGYKVCPNCHGTGELELGHSDPETGYPDTRPCLRCDSDGAVVDHDAVCETCLMAGKVVEYDVKLADGTQLCYDCADSNNPRVNEQ